jgi:uncharacterized membrane protein YkvI
MTVTAFLIEMNELKIFGYLALIARFFPILTAYRLMMLIMIAFNPTPED